MCNCNFFLNCTGHIYRLYSSVHKRRIEQHIHEILINLGHYFFAKRAEGWNKALYTMLKEKSLSSDRKYWTVRCLLANNHYRLNHYWSIFYLKKYLTGKLWDVHWQISHWTNKRKQKVVNKSKSWTAIPTQFRETSIGLWHLV